VTGWAAELAQRRVVDAIAAMGPASASREIISQGLVLTFDRAGQISAPGFVASGANASFVAEGDPIPVRQLAATAVLLDNYNIASLAVLTREMIESSNAEALIADALIRSAGVALDGILLDSNALVANTRPAGLRNGISTLTASNQADPLNAFAEDIVALINAVAPVGGNGPYIIVANPGRAAAMQLKFIGEISNLTILGSSALTTEIVAIAPGALVTAIDPEPAIETAKSASLHMDTAPVAVGSASPHKSMFQTDSMALKVRWPVSWMLRDPRGVAWMTPTWK
jgi:Phage capsid family